ncbi:MAG: Hsp20/alpha crystallin family protein [Deltaproteobacteria bacterium]|nr:Hsp20/alpha crystallin family protein [Deltaproteobacteria bacterium]MBW2564672.1 Hsp20/alpha crystallin family protein [Deltaproteobacteria bacterium]
MTIVKWDPFRNVAALQDRINRIFDESFSRTANVDDDISMSAWKPTVDIYETDEAIILKAELPGIKKEDVSVEIKDNVITLRGERVEDKEIKEGSYFRKERCFGTFSRAFNLQHRVQPDKIKAKFKDGILEIEIPKPEEEKPKQITVNVE